MNTLNGYSKSTLTDKYVLTAAGGHLAVGNASNNIPLNNSTINTNLNADLLDGKHASDFVTLTGSLTITGLKHFNTANNRTPLIISRSGSTSECIKIGINDGLAVFDYSNDEADCTYLFKMSNSDAESGNNNSNYSLVSFTGNSSGSTVTANYFSGFLKGNSTYGIFYIEGTGSTAGTWLGSHPNISSYYKGLTIAYKIPVAGASTTTLNINSLGAKTVYRNTGALTTHLPVNSVVLLVYDGTYFKWADYDANSYAYVRLYLTDTTATEYPLLFRYNVDVPTSYVTLYTRYDSAITVNPSTNSITAGLFKANNTAGPHFTGTSTSGNWAYLRLHNSTCYWDIATNNGSSSGSSGLWLSRYNGSSDGIFVSTTNNVGISTSSPSYKLHVVGTSYISSTLTMGSTINTCSSKGTWISGKTEAAIKFNSLTAINSGSFWRFYNMKSESGNVVCYGGLGDNIGFYGYYSGTTANLTDWKFTVATGTGHWTASGSIYAAHFYENSDKQLKINIQEIFNSDKMPIIKEFDWKESNSHSYGLIAQELEEQGYSELVSVKDDGYKTVNYSAALSLIVGKLQVKIRELEKEIENLKNKN